jgi:O-acetyl-ADP-ribose deacetylase (regulator of RNase III)
MIIYKTGNIFNSNAQVITNTVNCVGVMGKGIALQFKNKFPEMFLDYKKKCDNKEVNLGVPYLWNNGQDQILNFPTKGHWREGSNLSDIEAGLKYLAENYEKLEINSIALPPLGCGQGGLNWKDVKSLINKYLGPLDLLDVYVYEASEETMKLENEESQNKIHTSKKKEGLAAIQGSLF